MSSEHFTGWFKAEINNPSLSGYYQIYYGTTGENRKLWFYYDVDMECWYKETDPEIRPTRKNKIEAYAKQFFFWRGLSKEALTLT